MNKYPPYLYTKSDFVFNDQPEVVPPGDWKGLTPEMMVAGANVLDATGMFDWRDTALLAEAIYKAMEAAKAEK